MKVKGKKKNGKIAMVKKHLKKDIKDFAKEAKEDKVLIQKLRKK